MSDDDPAADPPLQELSPAEIARQFKEITESFAITMQFISEHRLLIETCRAALRAQGVTDEDFEAIRTELKRRWDAEAAALVGQIKTQRTVERLRKLLESASGPQQ